MKNQIDAAARAYVKFVSSIIDQDIEKAIRFTNNEMYDEANKMYDSFITQFYKYETKYYIRHWEGKPGTGQGENLYFGKDIRKYTKKPKLVINLPFPCYPDYMSNGGGQYSEPMEDDYRFNTAEEVLGYVFTGIRFPERMFAKEDMMWSGEYKGKYFSYQGTMKEAFDAFNMEFDKYASKAARNYLKTLGYY